MCPVSGVMFVVVAGTILAPVRPNLIGTSTEDPWKVWPFFGDRISTFAVLLGRGDGCPLGPLEPPPFEHAAISTAGMATSRIARLTLVRVTGSLLPLTRCPARNRPSTWCHRG